jgi:hypothetical protein
MKIRWQGMHDRFPGLKEFVERLPFDGELLDHIWLGIGETRGGQCTYPDKKKGRLKYMVSARIRLREQYPYRYINFVRPEFVRMSEHSYEVSSRYSSEEIGDAEDDMTWLVGHELFHFLRRTKQVPGSNTQSQANEYGFRFLREFKNWRCK